MNRELFLLILVTVMRSASSQIVDGGKTVDRKMVWLIDNFNMSLSLPTRNGTEEWNDELFNYFLVVIRTNLAVLESQQLFGIGLYGGDDMTATATTSMTPFPRSTIDANMFLDEQLSRLKLPQFNTASGKSQFCRAWDLGKKMLQGNDTSTKKPKEILMFTRGMFDYTCYDPSQKLNYINANIIFNIFPVDFENRFTAIRDVGGLYYWDSPKEYKLSLTSTSAYFTQMPSLTILQEISERVHFVIRDRFTVTHKLRLAQSILPSGTLDLNELTWTIPPYNRHVILAFRFLSHLENESEDNDTNVEITINDRTYNATNAVKYVHVDKGKKQFILHWWPSTHDQLLEIANITKRYMPFKFHGNATRTYIAFVSHDWPGFNTTDKTRTTTTQKTTTRTSTTKVTTKTTSKTSTTVPTTTPTTTKTKPRCPHSTHRTVIIGPSKRYIHRHRVPLKHLLSYVWYFL